MTPRRCAGTAPAALVLGWLAAVAPAPAAAEQAVTIQGSDCRIWDQYPDPRKTVRWSGGCADGWAHGSGVLEWSYDGRYDGRVEGSFALGRLEGPARVAWRDGRRLDGHFERGRASGHGTYIWPDGRRYDGEWQDDRRTGFGTLSFPDGTRYVGAFHRNRPTGDGHVETADGRRMQARLDAQGRIQAGTPLDAPSQSAAMPPPSEPATLDRWLEQPPPGTGPAAR